MTDEAQTFTKHKQKLMRDRSTLKKL